MHPRQHSDGHVALLAGDSSDGRPIHEVVPARPRKDGHWELLGTPALAVGCAAGDVLSVEEDGSFRVQARGGNLAVVSYVPKTAEDVSTAIDSLTRRFRSLGGVVEVPDDRRFVVVTVPAAVGFSAVEAEMQQWQAATGLDWYFGNVYDESNRPLGWWTDGG